MKEIALGVILLALLVPNPVLASGQSCIYSLLGSLVSGSDSCKPTGTPTVVSDVYGHASPDNGLLQYDQRLYFDDMNYPHGCPECYTQWSTNSDKAKLCQYGPDGNFWYPLSDDQKRVLLDLKENYTFFVCPFTGTPTQNKADAGMVGPDKIRAWLGPAHMEDAAFLHELNMTGQHIPSWLKRTAQWVLDGQISSNDLVQALRYLDENGVTR